MPQLKPLFNNLLVKEMTPAHVGKIFIPETAEKRYYYGMILNVGTPLDSTITSGTTCVFQRNALKKTKYGDVFKEQDILMIFFRGSWHPFGFRALVKRHNEGHMVGSIYIPDCYSTVDQTLWCHLIRLGIQNNKVVDFPLSCGDRLKIRKWDNLIHEIDLGNGYGLSVPINLLEYRKEN